MGPGSQTGSDIIMPAMGRMTYACENITSPKLRLRTVKMYFETNVLVEKERIDRFLYRVPWCLPKAPKL